jgi:type IV fimbrial biogenesis protein FimT
MVYECKRISMDISSEQAGIVRKHLKFGFTLIEVLISLSIMGILFAIALPGAQHFIQQTQDEILQQKIINAIELAKNESQIRRLPTGLCKSKNQTSCEDGGEWGEGQLIFMDENKDGVISNPEQIISVIRSKSISAHGKLYWRSFPNYRNYLSFSPTGLMKSDNGIFWHCHSVSLSSSSLPAWAIILNKMARIRIAYPDANGEIKDGHGKALTCVRGQVSTIDI